MIFDIDETEIFISQNETVSGQDGTPENELPKDLSPFTNGANKDIVAYPATWANTFGNNYYIQAQAREMAIMLKKGDWKAYEEGKPYTQPDLDVTSPDEIEINIQEIITDMEQEIESDEEQP